MKTSNLTSNPTSTLQAATSAPEFVPGSGRAGGVLMAATGLLAFAPLAILAPAIGWPASLGAPAAEQLAAIAAQPGAVSLGYGVYLLYSLLIAPVMIALAVRVFGGLQRPLAASVAAFAALSALARAIGILRWLTVMPALATSHARGDAAARAQIETLFNALTAYGGGIGEVLGVSLLMAASVGTLSVAAWWRGSMPRALAALGMLAAIMLLALAAPSFRLPGFMPVAAAVTTLSVWMIAVGVWMSIAPRTDRPA